MPSEENKNKNKSINKRKKTSKSPKIKKLKVVNTITKSKQLAQKIKIRKPRPQESANKCSAKGKPMPTLAELERLFADSDEDDDKPLTKSHSEERCKTPVQQPIKEEPVKFSPSTIQTLSNKLLDMITSCPEVVIIDDTPQLPFIPPKKRKKPDQPYIVNCKNRKQVNGTSNAVTGQGGTQYGFTLKEIVEAKFSNDENECPLRSKRSKITGKISKSRFNDKSDEIAKALMSSENEEHQSDSSLDSNTTVAYDCSAHTINKTRSFSPLPSTSTDTNVISKNDFMFNQSLSENSVNSCDSESDAIIMDVPCEKVIIDDDDEPEITSVSEPLNDLNNSNNTLCTDGMKPELIGNTSQIQSVPDDEFYSSIIIDDYTLSDNDCEIVDVDSVIIQNEKLINKYKKESETSQIIQVEIEPFPTNDSHIKLDSNESIESVVQNFFKENKNMQQNSVNVNMNSCSASQTVINNINLIMDQMLKAYESKKKHKKRKSTNIEKEPSTINLDDLSNDDSIVFVSSTSTNDLRTQPTLHNRCNDSVISIGSDSSIVTSTSPITISNSRKRKKPAQKRSTLAAPPTVNPVQAPNYTNQITPATPPSRRMGDCPICMETLGNNPVASTICGHVFCLDCIKAALKVSKKRCPTCRKMLKGVGFHPLFL